VVSAATAGEYTAIVTDNEWLVFAGGKWARWQLPSVPIVPVPSLGADATFSYIHNGYLYSVSMPSSTRSSFTLSQKFPLPERGQVRFVHVDGSGHCHRHNQLPAVRYQLQSAYHRRLETRGGMGTGRVALGEWRSCTECWWTLKLCLCGGNYECRSYCFKS
jgi:hypothetical protein